MMPLQLQLRSQSIRTKHRRTAFLLSLKKHLVNRDYTDDNEVFSISNPRFCTRTLEKGNHQTGRYSLSCKLQVTLITKEVQVPVWRMQKALQSFVSW